MFTTCNLQEQNPNAVPQKISVKDDNKPCCNSGYPVNCNPPGIVGLYTEDKGDIDITCECCQEIYQSYGMPDNLYEIEIYSTEIGVYLCVPNIGE